MNIVREYFIHSQDCEIRIISWGRLKHLFFCFLLNHVDPSLTVDGFNIEFVQGKNCVIERLK